MSLKENFYQALQELLRHGGLVGPDLEEKAKSNADLDSYLETTKGPAETIGAADVVNPSNFESANTEKPSQEFNSFKRFGKITGGQTDPSDLGLKDKSSQLQSSNTTSALGDFSDNGPTEEVTIISKNSFVEGNIRSFANVQIEGSVCGKLDVIKNVKIKGMLVGDLTCNNADLQGSSIQGNVFTKGNVFVDHDSVLLGDMVAQYARVDGRIKGNIEIGSKTEFGSNAVVLGNIKTGTICIADGANIQGFVNTAFLTEHGDAAFPNAITIDDTFMQTNETI